MSQTPEFSRPVQIAAIGDQARTEAIEATKQERAALAGRFGLPAIDALAATVALTRDGETVEAHGSLTAHVVQSCVVIGDPVPAHIDEAIALRFVPADRSGPDEEEIELSAEELDTLEHDGTAIDIGEAIAQSLALALDPFPRSAEADKAAREAGLVSEDEAGPFGALKTLRDKLEGE